MTGQDNLPPEMRANHNMSARRGPWGFLIARIRRSWGPILAGAIGALLIISALPGSLATGTSAGLSGGATVPVPAGGVCNGVYSPSPSALYVQLGEPSHNLSAGGKLQAIMEYAVLNYTSGDLGVPLFFPTVFFTFKQANGPNYSLTLPPQSLSISGPGWSNGSHTNRTAVVAGGLAFRGGGEARMSTQRLAIMAPVPYGALTLEFRWKWVMTQPDGTTTRALWTNPTPAYGGPTALPSIFFPAQYYSFLSGPGSGQSVTIGTNYTATLGGPVAGQYFFLEMEDGAGRVVQSHGQTISGNATTATVTIPLINYDGYLPPLKYLVHIHDACGAILYNKLVSAVFAPSASVTFYISPASCGAVKFNGTAFLNGTGGTFKPSTTPYSFSIPKCKGHSFNSWVTTGSLHISTGTQMLVSYNGTFSIKYN